MPNIEGSILRDQILSQGHVALQCPCPIVMFIRFIGRQIDKKSSVEDAWPTLKNRDGEMEAMRCGSRSNLSFITPHRFYQMVALNRGSKTCNLLMLCVSVAPGTPTWDG